MLARYCRVVTWRDHQEIARPEGFSRLTPTSDPFRSPQFAARTVEGQKGPSFARYPIPHRSRNCRALRLRLHYSPKQDMISLALVPAVLACGRSILWINLDK